MSSLHSSAVCLATLARVSFQVMMRQKLLATKLMGSSFDGPHDNDDDGDGDCQCTVGNKV